MTESQKTGLSTGVFADLNGDGISDQLTIHQDTFQNFSVFLSENPTRTINQWNFNGRLLNFTNDFLIIDDFDHNNRKEIYLISQSHDSVMLNCINDISNNNPAFRNVFIAKIGKGKWVSPTLVVKAEMDDLNEDGYKELIFCIKSGFEITPRNIYAYDIHNKKWLVSPFLGLSVGRIIQKDITGDGKNEILLQGHGTDNISDTTIQYHDRSAWLIVLDRKLNFLFKPIEFKGAYSYIWPFVFENGKSGNQAGFYVQETKGKRKSTMALFSKEGRITGEKELSGIPYIGLNYTIPFRYNGLSLVMIMVPRNKEALLLNQHLEIVGKRKLPIDGVLNWLDLDKDGQQEIIACDPSKDKLIIMRDDLSQSVTIDYAFGKENTPFVSLKEKGKEMPELVIWDKQKLSYIKYGMNPLYYLKWAIYLAIYLCILLFTWFIRSIQRYQIEQKVQIEKKITELQMKIVKNQLDPHFTLNAVNSIIFAVGNNEPERATEHLYHFSNLYRHLLLTADQYKCLLKEELNFTENYLKMEQLRFRDKYKYEIHIDEGVDEEVEVPKMCIQTAAENAVKHGIFQMREGGVITVNVFMQKSRLVIEVSDNGIGREAANSIASSSTHKGNNLTQQYFELYTKITNHKVTSEIVDLKDDSGNASGTKVVIYIQLN